MCVRVREREGARERESTLACMLTFPSLLLPQWIPSFKAIRPTLEEEKAGGCRGQRDFTEGWSLLKDSHILKYDGKGFRKSGQKRRYWSLLRVDLHHEHHCVLYVSWFCASLMTFGLGWLPTVECDSITVQWM